jgi:uncharacterized protein YggE
MDCCTDASQDRTLGLAFWALVALLLLTPGSLAHAAGAASDAGAREAPGAVSAEGVARLERAPEKAHLALAIVRNAPEAEDALGAAHAALRSLQEALAGTTIPHRFFTRGTTVSPQYRYVQNGPRALTHYEARLELEITTEALDALGTLLTVANGAGADTVTGLRYALADPLSHRLEALALATKRARATAQTLAAAADHRLGALLHLEADREGGGGALPQPMMLRAAAEMDTGPTLAPPPLTVEARVQVRYALLP